MHNNSKLQFWIELMMAEQTSVRMYGPRRTGAPAPLPLSTVSSQSTIYNIYMIVVLKNICIEYFVILIRSTSVIVSAHIPCFSFLNRYGPFMWGVFRNFQAFYSFRISLVKRNYLWKVVTWLNIIIKFRGIMHYIALLCKNCKLSLN